MKILKIITLLLSLSFFSSCKEERKPEEVVTLLFQKIKDCEIESIVELIDTGINDLTKMNEQEQQRYNESIWKLSRYREKFCGEIKSVSITDVNYSRNSKSCVVLFDLVKFRNGQLKTTHESLSLNYTKRGWLINPKD